MDFPISSTLDPVEILPLSFPAQSVAWQKFLHPNSGRFPALPPKTVTGTSTDAYIQANSQPITPPPTTIKRLGRTLGLKYQWNQPHGPDRYREWGNCGRRTSADQNIVRLMLFSINYDLTVLLKNRLALYHIDLVFLHQSGNPIAILSITPFLWAWALGKSKLSPSTLTPKTEPCLAW